MNIWHSLSGMIETEITSADPAAFLERLNREDIFLTDIQLKEELRISFLIHRKDYVKLEKICEKRGESISIKKRTGLWWTGYHLLKRPVLVLGLLLFVTIAAILPTRVLFCRVEGNSSIPSNRILEAAEICGIRFGATRREVRSERVKNTLLSAIPELKWAGINTCGCVAVISVKERESNQEDVTDRKVSSIVAARDGVIESVTVTKGGGMCAPGQVVREGQVLISGYTDCGISIIATRAEGEIYARTTRNVSAVTPSICLRREEENTVSRKISLLIGKKRINLWKDSGIWDATCGRMYTEYYITLPGGFQLPLGLSVETFDSGNTVEDKVSEADAQCALRGFVQDYLSDQMIAGSVLHCDLDFRQADGVYLLEGDYACLEMIGRERQEKIGEDYGKNS